jgi:hypothetical protein
MSGPIYYESNRGENRQSWAGALVLTCLALGFLAAMLELEQARTNAAREYAKATATSYVLQQARNEDLGKNLADENTRLVHLQSNEDSQPLGAALALNEKLDWGALFCDALTPLGAGAKYEVWGLGTGGTATQLGAIAPEAGQSVYPFSWTGSVTGVQRIEINSGDRAGGATLIYTGSLQ